MNVMFPPDHASLTGLARGSFRLEDLSPEPNDPPTTAVPRPREGLFAVIHVDAREARLLIARRTADGAFQTLRQEHEIFNLGPRGLEDPGQLVIDLANVLSRFQRLTELLGATVRAVATPSFLALPDCARLRERLWRVTRVPLQVISDREVARFVCMGVLSGRPPGHRSVLLDVGDHSTSIIFASATDPLAMWQLPLGTARLAVLSGVKARHPDHVRTVSWRQQIKDTLSAGHLDAIRGNAHDAILLRPRAWGAPPPRHHCADLVSAATAVLLDEVATYLGIRNTQASDSGLSEGVLVELSVTAAA